MSTEDAYQQAIGEARRICEELEIPCTDAALVLGAKCIERGRQLEMTNGLWWTERAALSSRAVREAMSARAKQLALMLPRKGEGEHA